MSNRNDGYPDSRDPETPRHALKRIAHEAHQIRQRAASKSGSTEDDIEQLATLVAELADVLGTALAEMEERA